MPLLPSATLAKLEVIQRRNTSLDGSHLKYGVCLRVTFHVLQKVNMYGDHSRSVCYLRLHITCVMIPSIDVVQLCLYIVKIRRLLYIQGC